MPFQAIAAMSESRVIGNHGKIPWHLPEDFRWFKHKTMGGTLIMGRKTFESIGKPLPGRKTVVLSRSSSLNGVEVYPDLIALEKALPALPAPYWLCGGADIYQQLLPKCSAIYLTCVKRVVEGDAFMPRFEDQFTRTQVIHDNESFRVERWETKDKAHHRMDDEPWPSR